MSAHHSNIRSRCHERKLAASEILLTREVEAVKPSIQQKAVTHRVRYAGRQISDAWRSAVLRARWVSPRVSGMGFHAPADLPSTISTM